MVPLPAGRQMLRNCRAASPLAAAEGSRPLPTMRTVKGMQSAGRGPGMPGPCGVYRAADLLVVGQHLAYHRMAENPRRARAAATWSRLPAASLAAYCRSTKRAGISSPGFRRRRSRQTAPPPHRQRCRGQCPWPTDRSKSRGGTCACAAAPRRGGGQTRHRSKPSSPARATA